MSIIKLENIVKIYGKGEGVVYGLNKVDLEIEKGELIAIMGPSGSGKSTLLNILGCLDKPTSGEYFLDGSNIKELKGDKLAEVRSNNIGFIFQSFNLLNEKNVIDNILVPLKFSNKKIKNKKEKVKELLQTLGLTGLEKKKINLLSGGQKQRVAIVRALINDPDIILADEPTGALDKKNGEEVMKILTELAKKGITVIIVTHDLKIGQQCERIIKILDGKIEMM
ncbi:MAG: ABC transporter ATP-binding protein [Clostridium sp.]|uniref:ABC transporter ATP-binding protein n=1 Tax=Clostridium sp. TaxID=1506 RepID=UPI003F2A7C7E